MHHAACGGFTEIIIVLHKKGLDVNVVDKVGLQMIKLVMKNRRMTLPQKLNISLKICAQVCRKMLKKKDRKYCGKREGSF